MTSWGHAGRRKRPGAWFLSALLPFAVAGCGGGGGTASPPTFALSFSSSPQGAGGLSNPLPARFSQGTAATLRAVPLIPGYVFSEWKESGAFAGTAIPLPLTMDSDRSVTAVMRPLRGSWTWVRGNEEAGVPGALGHYGVKGTPSPSNLPGSRRNAAAWTDTQGRLWMYGGRGYGSSATEGEGRLSDVWTFDPATREWTWVAGGDTNNLPPAVGTPGVASTSNSPGARFSASAWADTSSCALWLFGGFDFQEEPMVLNDLWRLDLGVGAWVRLQDGSLGGYADSGQKGSSKPTNRPGGRGATAVARGPDGVLWLFGGFGWGTTSGPPAGNDIGPLNDLWKFTPDPGNPPGNWIWVGGNPGACAPASTVAPVWPPGTARSAFCSDKEGNLWVFGGINDRDVKAGGVGISADLWRFSPSVGAWTVFGPRPRGRTELLPIRGALGAEDPSYTPGSRLGASLWADPGGRIWLFGGDNNREGQFADLWCFDPIVSGNWSWVGGTSTFDAMLARGTPMVASTGTSPSARRVEGASWLGKEGRLWLFGGHSNPESGARADLWMYLPP